MPPEYLRPAQCRYTFASMPGTLRARAGLVWIVTLVPPQNASLSSFALTFKFQSTIIRIKNLQEFAHGLYFKGVDDEEIFCCIDCFVFAFVADCLLAIRERNCWRNCSGRHGGFHTRRLRHGYKHWNWYCHNGCVERGRGLPIREP